MRSQYKVPAVVVGAGINGLGVIRSLGVAGVPVIVLDSDLWQPGMHCRYGHKINYQGSVVDALVRLGRRSATGKIRPVLLLTQERVVSEVSLHREQLNQLFRISLPPVPVLERLMRKDSFHYMAESIGAAVPKTLHVTDPSALNGLNQLAPPLIVKPAAHTPSYDRMFRKAYKIQSVEEARALVERILLVFPDVVIQEWIDGDDSDIFFCLQYLQGAGEPVASFVGRKLRSWPPYVGGTASCTRANEAFDQIEQTTTAFFRHSEVFGYASMEYKRDRLTGRFLMIEPTIGRTDYQEEVATLHGVNIPLIGYCSELGLPIPKSRHAQRARIWRDRAADRYSASLTKNDERAELPFFPVVDALWRISDPMPEVAQLIRQFSSRTLRLFSRQTSLDNEPKRNWP